MNWSASGYADFSSNFSQIFFLISISKKLLSNLIPRFWTKRRPAKKITCAVGHAASTPIRGRGLPTVLGVLMSPLDTFTVYTELTRRVTRRKKQQECKSLLPNIDGKHRNKQKMKVQIQLMKKVYHLLMLLK